MTDIEPPVSSETAEAAEPALDAIERDLDGVQVALARLADGTYWTDEVTGDQISVTTLEADPLARRS